jgi:hypothetical protein
MMAWRFEIVSSAFFSLLATRLALIPFRLMTVALANISWVLSDEFVLDWSLIKDCCIELVSRALVNLSAIAIESTEDSFIINSRLVMLDFRLFMMDCMLTTETTIITFQALNNLNISYSMNI